MKKIVSKLLWVACLLISNSIWAQDEPEVGAPSPKRWSSDKGYWVIETNVKQPQHSVVHFYTNHDQHIYSEAVHDKVLNTKKRKTLMRLKKALEKVVDSYETAGRVDSAGTLAVLLNKK